MYTDGIKRVNAVCANGSFVCYFGTRGYDDDNVVAGEDDAD